MILLVTYECGLFSSALVDDWDAATDAIACFFGDCLVSTVNSGGLLNNAAVTTTAEVGDNAQTAQRSYSVTVVVIVPAILVQTSTNEPF